MRERTFRWAKPGADNNGEEGWIPVNAGEGWFPGAGFLVAHDAMEHLSDKSDWAHELRATGVAVFDVDGIDSRNFSSIITDTLGFAATDHQMDAPPAPARWSKPLPPQHEKRLQRFAAQMRERIKDGLAKADRHHAKVPELERANAATFVDKALPWFRLGYRGALRVYGDRGVEVGALMDRLRDQVIADHDKLLPVDGERLTVTVDTKRLTAKVVRSTKLPLTERQRHHVHEDKAIAELSGLIGVDVSDINAILGRVPA